jgi:DNA polymerase-3 subunit alpha
MSSGTPKAERKANGRFKALYDFSERLDAKTVNRRQLENLAKAGAFDSMEPDRARALAACEIVAAYAQRVAEERASAQTSLFGAEEPSARPAFPKAPTWSAQDTLDAERESVGFYLSGHPLSDFFVDAGERYSTYTDILEEGETEPRSYLMAGVVRRIQYRPAMSGGTLAFISMSDPTGDFEGMVMPEYVDAARDVLEAGKAFCFRGRVRWRDGDMKLAADTFEPVEAAEARTTEDLRIILKEGAPLELLAQTIQALPKPAAGEARPLRLVLRLKDGREIELKAGAMVSGAPAARAALKAARGVERVM